MLFYYGIDWTYVVLVLPVMILALIAQANVSSTFDKYSKTRLLHSVTGAEAARMILDRNGLYNVRIERVSGKLTDHFDPRENVLRLSDSVYGADTAAAVGVAAHEAGHAIQYAQEYAPMKVRAAIIPACNFGSKLAIPLFLIGLFLAIPSLCYAGIAFFGLAALFQAVTLPVEFNASRRALKSLEETRRFNETELTASKKVLTAAALTYVAALATSLVQILRLLIIAGNSRRRN
ncbi:MAG: zinc metallopeptidase [Clostridia bacterium]|jgi:Zn-dependent membrane protease YugP|nr:zinc metallopeptidase [Clostridia bacterium]MBQ5648820.1 zinc metallopeptidase [Clostridia bacterium]MBR0327411.1 zinc metallopeptidase [Clostridia bacterium]